MQVARQGGTMQNGEKEKGKGTPGVSGGGMEGGKTGNPLREVMKHRHECLEVNTESIFIEADGRRHLSISRRKEKRGGSRGDLMLSTGGGTTIRRAN